jgi:hypothetical protein
MLDNANFARVLFAATQKTGFRIRHNEIAAGGVLEFITRPAPINQ